MKEHITRLIDTALESLVSGGELPAGLQWRVQIDRTRDESHGDLASNIALTLAKGAGRNPRELAAQICAALPADPQVERTLNRLQAHIQCLS